MKHWISRLGAGLLAVLMLVSLCACGGDTTVTTTTAGDDATTTVGDTTTTTVADDVTTTSADDVTTTVGDNEDPTTTEGEDPTTTTEEGPTTTAQKVTTTVNKVTTTKNRPWLDTATTKDRPWLDATTPNTTTPNNTTQGNDGTTGEAYATLPNITRDPKYDNPYGVYHSLLAYTVSEDGAYSKSQWMPSVGYIKDGEVQGVLYDSIIILPKPSNLLRSTEFSTKSKWDAWRRHTYKNLDNLNAAAVDVQNALNLKDYKVKVLLSIWEPDPELHGSWGKLTDTGPTLGARNDSESFEMVKYMVDSYITEMRSKNYSNLDFVGFYFFDEALDVDKEEFYKNMNEYVNSKDLIVVQAPYYKSRGYNRAREFGFDLTAMQSNYFHNKVLDGKTTTGSIRRLTENQKVLVAGNYTSGITVECPNSTNHDDVTTLKWTFAEALKHGTESAYHVYYFDKGANAPYNMSRSKDEYILSGYYDLYRYMSHTLTLENLQIDEYDEPQKVVDGAVEYL